MAYSTGGLELLVGLASEEIGGRDGPRITSACHCSSRVCEPGERRCNSRKMSPLLRSGLAISQDRICSHSPSKGSLWVLRQPSTRFRRSCSRYKVWSPAVGSPTLLSSGSFPMVQSSTEKTRVLAKGRGEITGEQLTAQRKTACCNCSSWCKRRMGLRAYATSVSSCCFSVSRNPDRRRRCNGVFAGS